MAKIKQNINAKKKKENILIKIIKNICSIIIKTFKFIGCYLKKFFYTIPKGVIITFKQKPKLFLWCLVFIHTIIIAILSYSLYNKSTLIKNIIDYCNHAIIYAVALPWLVFSFYKILSLKKGDVNE